MHPDNLMSLSTQSPWIPPPVSSAGDNRSAFPPEFARLVEIPLVPLDRPARPLLRMEVDTRPSSRRGRCNCRHHHHPPTPTISRVAVPTPECAIPSHAGTCVHSVETYCCCCPCKWDPLPMADRRFWPPRAIGAFFPCTDEIGGVFESHWMLLTNYSSSSAPTPR